MRQGTKASTCLYVEARMGLLAKNGTKRSENRTTSNPELERKIEKENNVSGQARTGDLPRRYIVMLGGRDNHYTTETSATWTVEINVFITLYIVFLLRARN